MNITLIRAELYKSRMMLRRNYFRLFDVSVWPIILFFAITLFLKFVSPGKEIMAMAIMGLIGWRAVYHFQIEPNLAYMEDFWAKNTSHQLASPLKIKDIIISGIIAGFFKFLIVLTIYLVLAHYMFSFEIIDMFKFIMGISYLCFSGAVIGIIALSFVVLYRQKAITFSFMIADLFVLLSGVYYPISIFPPLMVKLVHILPTFYGFELLKSMVGLGTANYLGMVIVGSIWLVIALLFLSYTLKKAKRNGSLCNFN